MAGIPPISIQIPQDHDLVGDVVRVAGVGTAFEGVLTARIRDDHGGVLVEESFKAGGTGLWDSFLTALPLGHVPGTFLGTVEVFEESSSGHGAELHKQVVRIAFGSALVQPFEYFGFGEHIVVAGDTLARIARDRYGDPDLHSIIFAANRDQLNDPDRIRVGQSLRIPERLAH